ncbi:MAG: hypothetical protein VXW32_00480, partial [Myxococcota bacterium]|nr:hypothetical protein [Myxococcota bacterium]
MRYVLPAFSFLLLVACGGDEGAGFTASITSPVSGTSVVEKQTVLLEGQVLGGVYPLDAIEASWWAGERRLCSYEKLDEEGLSTCEASLQLNEGTVTFLARKPGLAGLPDDVVEDERSFAVVAQEDAPQCRIVDPTTDTGMASGSSLEIRGRITSSQGSSSGEEVTWWSDREGQLGSSSVDSNERTSFVLDGLEDGLHRVEMRFAGGDFGGCSAELRVGVGPAPSIEIVAPSQAKTVFEGETLTAVAKVDHTDSVSLSWVSDIDGVLQTRSIRAGGQSTLTTNQLSAGVHQLSAFAEDELGVPGSDAVQVTVKGIPTAPQIVLRPEQPMDEDSLTVEVVVPSEDPEGESCVYRSDGYPNGELSGLAFYT